MTVAVLGGVSATSRTRTGLTALGFVDLVRGALLLLVVGQLGRIPVLAAGAKEAPLLLNDIVVVGLVVAGGLFLVRRGAAILDSVAVVALVFAAVGGLSAAYTAIEYDLSIFELAFGLGYLARWLVYFSLYVLCINLLEREDLAPVWRSLEAAVLLFAVFGIVQAAFLPGFALMVQPDAGWDRQYDRLVSTLMDPNFAGGLIVIVLLVQIALVSFGTRVALWKPALLGIACLLTFSRGAILSLFVGGAIIVMVRGLSKRVLVSATVAALALAPFVPRLLELADRFNKLTVSDGSAYLRVLSWIWGLEIVADHPILGVGFNMYGFVQGEYGYHGARGLMFGLDGGLLFIAVLTGLVGAAIYTVMILLVLRRCRRTWRGAGSGSFERGLGVGAAAATVAFLVHSVFLSNLLYPFLLEVLWVLWAMVFVASSPPPSERPVSDRLRAPSSGLRLAALPGGA